MRRRIDPMVIIMLALMVTLAFRQGAHQYASPMDWVMEKVYILPGIIIGLSFHEFAHAWAAKKLGDKTAELQGRVTINPAAHIDIVGFVSLLILGFGWGIPVPVDERNFKHPRRDNIIVSLAGVTMNLLIAVVFTVILKIVTMTMGYSLTGMTGAVWTIIFDVVMINLVLMVFNLMPIPPLDGFNLITEVFRLQRYSWWSTVYRNGYIFLMAFILFDISGRVLTPILNFLLSIIFSIL